MMIKEAILIASEAHKDDKWGEYPYLLHLALTADAATELLSRDHKGISVRYAVCAAWLHDVIEDHPELEEKVAEKFPHLVGSLKLLARSDDDTYGEYVEKVISSGDKLALLIKISDMSVNLGNNPPDRLRKRYEKHFKILLEAWRKI